MSPLYTPTRNLALPSSLVHETVITGAAYGTVIDATGIHNALWVGDGPRATTRLHDYLESRDAANELPDGSLLHPRYVPPVVPPPPLKYSHGRRRKVPAHFWDAPKIAQAFQAWVVEHGEVPKAIDWNPSQAVRRGKPELAERFRAGVWPTATVVAERCGSWNAGLERAGLAVRPPYRVAT